MVLPPFVLGVAAGKLRLHGGVVDLPEARQVIGDLDRAVIGCQNVQQDFGTAVGDGDGAGEVVELLDAGAPLGRLPCRIAQFHLAPFGQGQRRRGQPVHLRKGCGVQ